MTSTSDRAVFEWSCDGCCGVMTNPPVMLRVLRGNRPQRLDLLFCSWRCVSAWARALAAQEDGAPQ